jgi:hypothetical protein
MRQSKRSLLGPDYSSIELRVAAGLAAQGIENAKKLEADMETTTHFAQKYAERQERARAQMSTFSQIYGTQREEIISLMSLEEARKMTSAFLKNFPGTVDRYPGLRKVKTKMIVNALVQGTAENGNHFVTCFEDDYHFYYRGTLIYKYNAVKDEEREVHAGVYEDTASTRNQRKEIKKAIQNFREAVLTV